jgi:uncharacterized membrane protein
MSVIKRSLVAGLMTAIPLWITWLLVKFLFELVIDIGEPAVLSFFSYVHATFNVNVDWIFLPLVQKSIAALIVVVFLFALGWITTKVFGRRLIAMADALLDKIPMIKTVYGGSKRLLQSFQQQSQGAQRVVLINYPSPEMKTIGLLTRTLTDSTSGRQLAAVYVPTTPNPTSGFLEIVPVADLVFTDWSVNDAISFVVSGGAIGPEDLKYENIIPPPERPHGT